uniref:Ubiquitin-protein ligase n=1 Tax=Marseillevirus LCMAC101 TaxID=2506602 RepID=A0A481YRM9_9VIRU|nr:MAG: ubiquitin-protein ligase [Marseillevirus LCMAC101]
MGKFYFCKGGSVSQPCNSKYLTAKNWLNHMEKKHNITNAALPLLEENNNTKRILRVKRERIQKQRETDEKVIKALEEQLRSMSQRVTNAESSAAEKEQGTQTLLEDAKRRLELSSEEAVASGTEDCIICMTEQTTTAIIPCGHTAFCGDCAHALEKRRSKCPICRGDIQQTQRLFFS